MRCLLVSLLALTWIVALAPSPAQARSACLAPQAVCDVRDVVFRIKSFDPFGSAVRIGKDVLVTNRHVVADETSVTVFTQNGPVQARVIPTKFRGDIVKLKVTMPDGPVAVLRTTPLTKEDRLHTVGYDLGQRNIRVYIDGGVLATPAEGYELARVHHTAHTQPGNSGGAVVDAEGRLIGIATSGGAGIFEAVPASSFKWLTTLGGPQFTAESQTLGAAYRDCTLATEAARRVRAKMPVRIGTVLENQCLATDNRQLIALAAQAFGRVRDFDTSERLFNKALEIDPNALNSRLGLVTTLLFARKPKAALPHVRTLLTTLPRNITVHRMAIQTGKLTGDKALVATALDAIRMHNPKGLDAAERFLKQTFTPRQKPAQ